VIKTIIQFISKIAPLSVPLLISINCATLKTSDSDIWNTPEKAITPLQHISDEHSKVLLSQYRNDIIAYLSNAKNQILTNKDISDLDFSKFKLVPHGTSFDSFQTKYYLQIKLKSYNEYNKNNSPSLSLKPQQRAELDFYYGICYLLKYYPQNLLATDFEGVIFVSQYKNYDYVVNQKQPETAQFIIPHLLIKNLQANKIALSEILNKCIVIIDGMIYK
jgi:hypothetical protein